MAVQAAGITHQLHRSKAVHLGDVVDLNRNSTQRSRAVSVFPTTETARLVSVVPTTASTTVRADTRTGTPTHRAALIRMTICRSLRRSSDDSA
ncbi:hypothetical protein SGA01_36690 [Streptomyces gardneri]|uniref:Uncharacterized protein n=1 Tax=Streptomyces gardneri TaxID=66892 RepID=A0A4Y3RL76_9ACTN|nr:hypothetical protein SGA01_36690 [Streptomyces gardneri]